MDDEALWVRITSKMLPESCIIVFASELVHVPFTKPAHRDPPYGNEYFEYMPLPSSPKPFQDESEDDDMPSLTSM